MKIAFLTLRVDNNYGGNLQRFALSRILRNLGHDVIFLQFRSEWNNDKFYVRFINIVKNIICSQNEKSPKSSLYWKVENPLWEERRKNTFPFFKNYVKHSPLLWSIDVLKKYISEEDFEAYIVGSDQVWRKTFTKRWGLERFFLDFVPDNKIKVFYSASFGQYEGEYTSEDIQLLTPLYQKFNAVSVREESALHILEQYGWTSPAAVLTLDPTLVLDVSVYMDIVKNSTTHPSAGNMFCYILDTNDEIDNKIKTIAKEKGLTPFYASLTGKHSMSIEQWLKSFIDAEYIVTDSYHGLVFSIIFNKPFYLLYNEFRGNARFDSLLHVLNIKDQSYNWEEINSIIENERNKSIAFIKDALELKA